MNQFRKAVRAGHLTLVTAFIVPAVPASGDEVYPFQVAFEEVPGVEYLVSGDLARGIRILEQDLASATSSKGHVLATLCGAYVLKQQLAKAERTCAEAIARLPGETAYNNRGVLRAFRGDFEGARRDFARASPADMDEYMEILRTRDIGLVAGSNRELLLQLSARHSSGQVRSSSTSVKGAAIEIIDD